MRINSADTIAGQPALAIRQLFKKTKDSGGTISDIVSQLHVDQKTAQQTFETLCAEGYIEPTETPRYADEDNTHWQTTLKGNTLALATARKPITRKTAERLVKEFLHRVEEINACNDYIHYVQQVLVFGSYLSDSPTLGDVDLAVELAFRHNDIEKRGECAKKRIEFALQHGKQFRSSFAQLTWPYIEVLQLLKKHSPSISLHDLRDEQILSATSAPSQILFEADIKPDS